MKYILYNEDNNVVNSFKIDEILEVTYGVDPFRADEQPYIVVINTKGNEFKGDRLLRV